MLLAEHVRLIYLGLLAASLACGAELRGVLYSDESGPSGHGTGRVRLFSNGAVAELAYQKPFLKDFADKACAEPGAIWDVTVDLAPDAGREIVRASCQGRTEPAVHDAWTLAAHVLQLIGTSAALPETIFAHSLSDTARLRSIRAALGRVDVEDYVQFGRGGLCLRIISASEGGSVIVSAGKDCYLTTNGVPVGARFTIARQSSGTMAIADFSVRE